MTSLNTEDFAALCRTCLLQQDAEKLLAIEGIYFAGDVKLMDVLVKHTSIEEEHALGFMICDQCVLRAEQAHTFFKKCNESNEVFKQYEDMIRSENNEFDSADETDIAADKVTDCEIITIKNDDHEDFEIKIIFDSNSTDGLVKQEKDVQNEYSDTDKYTIDHEASLTENVHIATEKCKFCHMILSLEEFEDHKVNLGHFEESDLIFCPHCEISSRNITSFKRHLRTHSNRQSKKYMCETCGKVFKWSKNYQEHLKNHEGSEGEKFICPECGLLLNSMTAFQIHRGKEHAEELGWEQSWSCHYCEKSFDQIATFKKHLKEVHALKDFHCIICGKDCMDKRTLYYHEQLHLDDFGIECEYCHKKLLTEEKLLLHQRIHKYVKKKHVCTICNKGFKQLDKLEAHVRVHTGEKPFTCNFCGKAFNHQNNLTHHVRLHTGDTPYKCLFCSKEFSNSHSLRKHMNNHEGDAGEDYMSA